ncbi:MAG: fatty acyl-AMP ligase [Candidatus Sericytochromatia bacterium]
MQTPAQWIEEGFPGWNAVLAGWARLEPERIALRFLPRGEWPEQTLSYAQLASQAQALAQILQTRYAPGSRLLLLFEPGLDFCVAFWACLLAGQIAVPLYPPADPRTSERFLALAKDAGAAGVLTTTAIHRQVTLARWFHPTLRKLSWLSVDALQAPVPGALTETGLDALALLQYTSGSTGTPRGVMLSHRNLLHNMACLDAARNTPTPFQDEIFLAWLPLYHDMGLMSGVVYPVALGCTSTLFSPLYFLQKPLRWLQALSRTRATISSAPNFAYDLCLRRLQPGSLDGLDLSAWRLALNGAEAIRPATLRAFRERLGVCGLRDTVFYPCYGLAESTVFVTGGVPESPVVSRVFSATALQQHRVAPPHDAADARELVGVGRPWRDTELAIVDPETRRPCGSDQVGEIWLRGGSIGQGYWQRDSRAEFAAERSDQPGRAWLRTGDLGFLLEGELFLTGRLKDLIILNGQNYAPQSFEEAVEDAHAAFRRGCCAAIGVGDPEGLVILQEVRKGCTQPAAELEAAARSAISEGLQVPVQDVVLLKAGSLPKTSSGKLQRRRARELYLQGKWKRWKA